MTFLDVPPAFDWPVQFCAAVTGLCYVVSIITSNFSQVDRVWTFLPTIYAAYYALLPLWPNEPPFFLAPYAPKSLGHSVLKNPSPRAVLMLALVVVWMFRLSYNTYRRGLFSLWESHHISSALANSNLQRKRRLSLGCTSFPNSGLALPYLEPYFYSHYSECSTFSPRYPCLHRFCAPTAYRSLHFWLHPCIHCSQHPYTGIYCWQPTIRFPNLQIRISGPYQWNKDSSSIFGEGTMAFVKAWLVAFWYAAWVRYQRVVAFLQAS